MYAGSTTIYGFIRNGNIRGGRTREQNAIDGMYMLL